MTKQEAIKIVKEFINSTCLHLVDQEALETLIPELAESEDERIRKEMIRYFTEMKKGGSAALPYDDCIAYLERQKETGIRWFKSDDVKNPDKPYIDKAGMFYTTDGRMCYASNIEKQKGQEPISFTEPYNPDDYEVVTEGNATGLKKKEQKSAWNEEDKRDIVHIIQILDDCYDYGRHDLSKTDHENLVNKLKSLPSSLKDKEIEWSEEDRQCFDEAIEALESLGFDGEASNLKSLRDYRKPLNTWKPAGWSNEDEENFEWFDKFFRAESVVAGGKDIPQDKYLWFKSLRPSWKPSEEQMTALRLSFEDVFDDVGYCNRYHELKLLYEQLKKLI